MGIFTIASRGRRIGIQGWSKQNGLKFNVIKKCTKSKESEKFTWDVGRILQSLPLTAPAIFVTTAAVGHRWILWVLVLVMCVVGWWKLSHGAPGETE